MDVFCFHSLGNSQFLERNIGIVSLELFQCHLVVVSLRVAQLSLALGNESQRCLEAEHSITLGNSLGFCKSKKTEHAHDVLFVSLTYSNGSLVVVQVIVFLSERQSTLRNVQDIHRDVLLIGSEITTERHTIAKDGIFLLQRQQI